MIDDLLAIVAPHHCCGCDKIGTLLCDNCKYDITSEVYSLCVACGKGLAGVTGICTSCHPPYARGWCIGERQDHLQRLIGEYKFSNVRSAYRPLAVLLDDVLPELPSDAVIMPIPTVASHVRQRGYDHMLLIARYFAKKRGLRVSTALQRATSTKQRDAGRAVRIKQAKAAFAWPTSLDPDITYILLDDVMTTGATMEYAARTLMGSGAKTVWIITISRQALD